MDGSSSSTKVGRVINARPMATFEYMHHALAHPLAGVDAGQVVAGVFDHATADFGTLGAHQPGDRLERGALAGAIGAEQGDDGALGHL